MAALTSTELAAYRERGYVVPQYQLGAERIEGLRTALARVLEKNPNIRPEQLVSVHIAGLNDEGVHGDSAFLEVAREPGILDCVAQLIGPDIILWGCQIFCKPGGDGMEVPLHQDGHYWPIRPLATCTVWLAIDPSTTENGCLRVVPGSHHGQQLIEHTRDDRERLTLNRRVADGTIEPDTAVDVELEPGQMSMHDIYMVHGSAPNTSAKRRAGLSIRYMPATSHFRRDLYERSAGSGYTVDFGSRPLWLVRGEDRCGRNDFQIGHNRGQVGTAAAE